jgi:hypothetical protein
MEGLKIRVILLLLGILFISLFVSTKMATEGFQGFGGNSSNFSDANANNSEKDSPQPSNKDSVFTEKDPPKKDPSPEDVLTAKSVDHVVGKMTNQLSSFASSMIKSYLIQNGPIAPAEGFTSVPFAIYS